MAAFHSTEAVVSGEHGSDLVLVAAALDQALALPEKLVVHGRLTRRALDVSVTGMDSERT